MSHCCGRTATDLPTLPADFSILDQLKKRVELAKQIDQARHRLTKQAHEDKWLRDAAEAMEIDLDDDDEGCVALCLSSARPYESCVVLTSCRAYTHSSDADSAQVSSRKQRAQSQARSRALRAELDQLLAQPLMVRGVSAKYLTTRGRVGLVDQLVGGTGASAHALERRGEEELTGFWLAVDRPLEDLRRRVVDGAGRSCCRAAG